MQFTECPDSNGLNCSTSKSIDSKAGPGEHDLLQRIALGLSYSPAITNPATILSFGLNHIVDFLSPVAISIWKNESESRWSLLASDGQNFPLPTGFDSWAELNQRTILMMDPTAIPLNSEDSGVTSYVHWSVPILLPGWSGYVLHLLARKSETSKEIISTFLRAFTFLVVNCDGSKHFIETERENSSGFDESSLITNRQKEILRLAEQDFTYAQIGTRMGFSESTIKQEAMKIFRILGVHSREQALTAVRE